VSPTLNFLANKDASPGPFVADRLSDIAKWSAGGFGLLVTILTFLGIKEGYLDRILAESPRASVWVFAALGLGVVTSLIGAATNPKFTVYAAWTIAAVLVLSGITYFAVPDIDGDDAPTAVFWCGVAIGLAVLGYSILRWSTWHLSLPAALLLIAVTATSLGLYSAVKISVASKALPEDLDVGTPTIQVVRGVPQVRVHLEGSQQTYRAGLVRISGVTTDGKRSSNIGTARYRPDETNSVDQTLSFPLSFRTWKSVSVSHCEMPKDKDTCKPETRGTYSVDASLFAASVTATMRQQGASIEAAMVGRGVPRSHFVRFTVFRRAGAASAKVVQAEIAPTRRGVAQWSSRMPATAGAAWTLVVKVCGPRSCRQDLTRTASLRPMN
jgi:hypothetical protein